MRTLVLGITALALSSACGEVVPLTPDAPVDAPEIDANTDICAQSTLTVDDFFTCVGRAVCAVYSDCIGSDTTFLNCDDIPISVFGGLEPTAAKVVINAATAAGRTTWNPTAAKACLDTLTDRGCSLFKRNETDPFATCEALVGAVNNGDLCQNDVECATTGAQCERNPTAPFPGNQCTDFMCRAPVPAGMACTGGAICRPEDRCMSRRDAASGNDTSICVTGEAGQACDADEDCDSNLFCNGGLGNASAAGICTAAKAAGATCKTDEECMGEMACVGNFAPMNGTCRDVRQPGATCDTNNFTLSCHGHQTCETTAANMTGTCKPAPGLGQTCVPVNGNPYCGFFLACDNGLCREPGALGDTCTVSNVFGGGGFSNVNGCNLGLYCSIPAGMTSGTCVNPLANASSCTSDRGCDSDYCSPSDPRTCQTYPTCTF